ncbi:hypothetical protein BDV93DRAFT_298863 [Ceratobasidium sp. AG-I]|nr:hypothetical protein BDV93DRAFT_298863 [Ceratobasidium sp. AG-I]
MLCVNPLQSTQFYQHTAQVQLESDVDGSDAVTFPTEDDINVMLDNDYDAEEPIATATQADAHKLGGRGWGHSPQPSAIFY